MKQKILVVSLFLLLIMPLRAEQSLRVEYLDGSEMRELLSNISRWEIDGENETFRLIALDGTLLFQKSLYDDIARIVFFEDKGNTEVSLEKNEYFITAYPNPTSGVLFIKGVSQGEIIRVFSLEGRLIISQEAGSVNETLDVSVLDSGVYLLQVNTDFFKIIKQ